MASGTLAVTLEWGIAARSRSGQTASGDLAVVTHVPDGTVVAAVDGCGHGAEAARVAGIACELVRRSPCRDLVSLASQCHEALRWTQ